MLKTHLHLPRLKSGIDCISVKDGDAPVYYVNELIMRNVTFKVYESGRQRAILHKQRNVHAFVIGDKTSRTPVPISEMSKAYYNPFICETFVNVETGAPIHNADAVYMLGKDVYYV